MPIGQLRDITYRDRMGAKKPRAFDGQGLCVPFLCYRGKDVLLNLGRLDDHFEGGRDQRELGGSEAEHFAVGLEEHALGGIDAHGAGASGCYFGVGDMATVVDPRDVANQVNFAQVAQHDDVERAIGETGVGRDLHAAPEVLPVGDHEAICASMPGLATIQTDFDVLVVIGEESTEQAAEVGDGAAQHARARVGAEGYLGIEAEPRGVGEEPLTILTVEGAIGDVAEVKEGGAPRHESSTGSRDVGGDTGRPSEVATTPCLDEAKGDVQRARSGRGSLQVEWADDAIDGLEEAAIAAYDDDSAAPGEHGSTSEPRNLATSGGDLVHVGHACTVEGAAYGLEYCEAMTCT